jgi:FkbM family methyltransferase
MISSARKVIYDVGSNNGDDIPYYLMKGDIVVAIEANPALCEGIRKRFSPEIKAGRLVVENFVVTASGGLGEVDFYLHKFNHVLSQFPKPSEVVLDQFTRCRLPTRSILDIIYLHGNPYYIKLDIEHYDAQLLRAIFEGGITPPYISSECHSLDVFSVLVERGGYKAFKLVDGASVVRVYKDRSLKLESTQKYVRYSFPYHSAGPFGNDIDGKWMTKDSFFRLLAFEGFGWKDIHATNTESSDESEQPDVVKYLDRLVDLDQILFYLDRKAGLVDLLPYVGIRILRSIMQLPHLGVHAFKMLFERVINFL